MLCSAVLLETCLLVQRLYSSSQPPVHFPFEGFSQGWILYHLSQYLLSKTKGLCSPTCTHKFGEPALPVLEWHARHLAQKILNHKCLQSQAW